MKPPVYDLNWGLCRGGTGGGPACVVLNALVVNQPFGEFVGGVSDVVDDHS